MNRKGFAPALIIPLALAIIIVILGVTGTIAFFASTKYMLIIIGVIFIASGIFIAAKSVENDLTNKKIKFTSIFFIIGIALIIIATTGVIQTAFDGKTFTPVYCNDYSFTCCAEQQDSVQSKTIGVDKGTGNFWVCPSFATKCVVSSATHDFYVGSSNCGYSFGWRYGGGWYFHCDDDVKYTNGATMRPGQYLMGGSLATTPQIVVYKAQLIFTGRATNVQGGVPVRGADGCTFNPGATYEASGKLLSASPSTTSYTIPLGQCMQTYVAGDRHICGNAEESCKVNSDCGGHTYGNKECIGRSLQTYGCRNFGTPSTLETYLNGYAYKPFVNTAADASSNQALTISRCEVTSTQTVQCCGDNDCGANAVCDTSTFTCKQAAQVQCRVNSDCGVSQVYDQATKTLRTPICTSAKCDYKSVALECYYNSECSSGYTCSNDYKCVQSNPSANKQQCTSECCVNDANYFDRPCPSDKPNCVNHVCTTNAPESTGEETQNTCEAKAKASPLLGYTWVTQTTEPSIWKKIITFGTAKPTVTGYCKASFVPYYIFGAVIVITGISIVLLLKPTKRRRK